MTALEQTAQALRPWLGSAFVAAHARLMERVSLRLTQFLPRRDSLQQTAQDLDTLLFMAVRDHTQGRMVLTMDGGQAIRVRVSDFPVMADDLLWLLFSGLSATGTISC